MSYLKNIITYFFHHPASDGVVERVHQRLADTNSGQEKEEVFGNRSVFHRRMNIKR